MAKIKLVLMMGGTEECRVNAKIQGIPYSQRVNEENFVSDFRVSRKSLEVTPEKYLERFKRQMPRQPSLLSLYGILVNIAQDFRGDDCHTPPFSIQTEVKGIYQR